MAKRKLELTEKKIQQMEKEGRGQGEGSHYKPWITIQDFPSSGLVTRGVGWKTKRIHQFLSKLERNYFYALEWNQAVVDIREQYPLIREDTMAIALDKGIKHPCDPKTDVPIVMTTDFLITVSNSKGTHYYARTIKPAKELEKARVIEKFEIERAYWESRGISWGIVTEKEIPQSLIENVEWLHSSYFNIQELPPSAMNIYKQHMMHCIELKKKTIIDIVTEFDRTYQLEDGTGLDIFKHLIARQEIKVNIHQRIQTHLYLEDIILM